MKKSSPGTGIQQYYTAINRLQAHVIESQKDLLAEIAEKMAELVRLDRRIFLFGTGHSHLLVEEGYFRAGGLAAVVPMFVPQVLMLHESARMSSLIERMPELAYPILDEYDPQPGELLIIYADSGSNALPVQLAIEANQRGVLTVGICSRAFAKLAPVSKAGKKLTEVANYIIDNGGTPGDALVDVKGISWRTAASSTLIGVLIWNCLLSETVRCLVDAGAEPPIFASYNMVGAIDHNQSLLAKWSQINPHLPARTIQSNR